jgi:hypothetical protein
MIDSAALAPVLLGAAILLCGGIAGHQAALRFAGLGGASTTVTTIGAAFVALVLFAVTPSSSAVGSVLARTGVVVAGLATVGVLATVLMEARRR